MTIQAFLEGLEKNACRVTEYRLGMDGRGGGCDCIGLIIGAIRMAGGAWQGTHGSNYAARYEMRVLQAIPSAAFLQAGDVVFKARVPGQEGYSLPSVYRQHPDQKDYYHVGVVESVNPLSIIHCTAVPGGIRHDTVLGQWAYCGRWRGIEERNPQRQNYRVTGGALKIRSVPEKNGTVIGRLPDGAVVSAAPEPEHPAWLQVEYAGKMGYCMAMYLQAAETAERPDVPSELQAILEQALAIVRRMGKNEVNN